MALYFDFQALMALVALYLTFVPLYVLLRRRLRPAASALALLALSALASVAYNAVSEAYRLENTNYVADAGPHAFPSNAILYGAILLFLAPYGVLRALRGRGERVPPADGVLLHSWANLVASFGCLIVAWEFLPVPVRAIMDLTNEVALLLLWGLPGFGMLSSCLSDLAAFSPALAATAANLLLVERRYLAGAVGGAGGSARTAARAGPAEPDDADEPDGLRLAIGLPA